MQSTIRVETVNPSISLKKSLVSKGNTFFIFVLSKAVAIANSLPPNNPKKTQVVDIGIEFSSLKT